MNFRKLKFAFAIVIALYFFWVALYPQNGSFLDLVDLPIHEAGHILFTPFGQFLTVAGGTLLQLIVPTAFIVSFLYREDYYAASVTTHWLGQSFLNVYVYAADAVKMQLVLLGGLTGSEGAFHDWNFMLTETGLIEYTNLIASLIRLCGTLLIILAAVCSLYFSWFSASPDTDAYEY
jgi:hypothetical protein